jgi:Na+/proline symporter
VGGGFSAPATAIALMGKNGAVLMLLLLFMAITSATSGELIAVSSLWTFDVYKLYINPSASSSKLVFQSHCSIIAYSLILAAFCCGLSASGVNITWILTQGGVIIGGGGVPLGLILLWPSRLSTVGAIAAPLIAMPLGITAWLVTTHFRLGSISVATTGDLTNALVGSATTCGTGAVVAIVASLLCPYKYTSTNPLHISRVEKIRGVVTLEGQEISTSTRHEVGFPMGGESKAVDNQEVTPTVASSEPMASTGNEAVDFLLSNHIEPLNLELYARARRLAIWACSVFFVFAMVLFPFTFYGTAFIFTKAAFTGWIVISLIWVFFSAAACIIWPIAESFPELKGITQMVIKDTRKRFGKTESNPRTN